MSNLDMLFSDLDRMCRLLVQSYGVCAGSSLSQEELTKKDLLLDLFMGTISTVFHKITDILTGHTTSSLEAFVRLHKRAVAEVLSNRSLPYADIVLPSPEGMVWDYKKTITALNDLYKQDPPHETVQFLKDFSRALSSRDRVTLAATLAKVERTDHVSSTTIGLSDLFVAHALGYKTAKTLFGDVNGLKSCYDLLTGMNDFYSQAIIASSEIKSLETTIQATILKIIKGDLIDQDSAAIAAKTLRLLCGKLRAMSSLLVKMDTVEQNYVGCLQHLIRKQAALQK